MSRSNRWPCAAEWAEAARRLTREQPKRFRAFDLKRPKGFKPLQRRAWLAYSAGEQKLPRIDPESVLPFVASQATLAVKELVQKEGDDLVLYGVHKKGASFLEDLVGTSSAIGRQPRIFDDVSDADLDRAIRGHPVLIIDDSIHQGETCPRHIARLRSLGARRVDAFVVVASSEGLKQVAAQKVEVRTSVNPVDEELFTLAFGLLIVPMLGLFRNGALSNRPHRSFRISSPATDRDGGTYRCLRLISRLEPFGVVNELPPVDGRPARVFHGTAELSALVSAELARRFESVGKVDQADYRLFLSRIDGSIHLCVCAIVWPDSDPGLSRQAVEEACDREAAWLLGRVERSLRAHSRGAGLRIRRVPPPISIGPSR